MTLFPSRSSFREKAETSCSSWNTHLEADQTNENHGRHALSWGVFSILGKRASTGYDSSAKMSQAWCQAPRAPSSVLTSQWDTGCWEDGCPVLLSLVPVAAGLCVLSPWRKSSLNRQSLGPELPSVGSGAHAPSWVPPVSHIASAHPGCGLPSQ